MRPVRPEQRKTRYSISRSPAKHFIKNANEDETVRFHENGTVYSLNPIREYKDWVEATYGRPLADDNERLKVYSEYLKERRKYKLNIIDKISLG